MRPTAPRVLPAALLLTTVAVSQWSTPVPMANVNSTAVDGGAALTADGLTMYFHSFRSGNFEIFTATRATPYGPFGPATQVMELASPGAELRPWPRGDNLEIFFQRATGGPGGYDIWRADRPSTAVPFQTPVPVTEISSTVDDVTPSLTLDGLRIYFASNRPRGSHNLWTATRPSRTSPFGAPTPITELSTTSTELAPCSSDGLVIFFASNRPGGLGGDDIWMASRLDTASPFGDIVNVTALNSSVTDGTPGFSSFPDEILLHSEGRGGMGGSDVCTARFTGLVASGIAGVRTSMDLRFSDPSSPGKIYVAAASLGTSPGIPIDTRVLPLNFDFLFANSIGGVPPILTGYLGALNADGIAAGVISFAQAPQAVGLRFFTAFVVFDPAATSGIHTLSNALQVKVQ